MAGGAVSRAATGGSTTFVFSTGARFAGGSSLFPPSGARSPSPRASTKAIASASSTHEGPSRSRTYLLPSLRKSSRCAANASPAARKATATRGRTGESGKSAPASLAATISPKAP